MKHKSLIKYNNVVTQKVLLKKKCCLNVQLKFKPRVIFFSKFLQNRKHPELSLNMVICPEIPKISGVLCHSTWHLKLPNWVIIMPKIIAIHNKIFCKKRECSSKYYGIVLIATTSSHYLQGF